MYWQSTEYPSSINEADPRPKTTGECGSLGDPLEPCPYVSCKYHLYLDVSPETGAIKINHPDKELHELEATCALKVADRGGVSEPEIGRMLNVVREMAGILVDRGVEKVKRHLPVVYREFVVGEVTRGIEPEKDDTSGVHAAATRFLKKHDPLFGKKAQGNVSLFASDPDEADTRVWDEPRRKPYSSL